MNPTGQTGPDWDRLYETALAQEGHFTTQQALDAGYSSQLLMKYLTAARSFASGGLCTAQAFPSGQQEDLVALWLWSNRAGVFSHETALMLHELSDVLPARAHLTVPAKWRRRRIQVPDGVVLHYADVPKRDRAWVGAVPVTSPARTLVDCAADYVSPDFLSSAISQALARGMVSGPQATAVERAVAAELGA